MVASIAPLAIEQKKLDSLLVAARKSPKLASFLLRSECGTKYAIFLALADLAQWQSNGIVNRISGFDSPGRLKNRTQRLFRGRNARGAKRRVGGNGGSARAARGEFCVAFPKLFGGGGFC